MAQHVHLPTLRKNFLCQPDDLPGFGLLARLLSGILFRLPRWCPLHGPLPSNLPQSIVALGTASSSLAPLRSELLAGGLLCSLVQLANCSGFLGICQDVELLWAHCAHFRIYLYSIHQKVKEK